MPTLPITKDCYSNAILAAKAGDIILSYITFPNNPQKRQALEITLAASYHQVLKDFLPTSLPQPAQQHALSDMAMFHASKSKHVEEARHYLALPSDSELLGTLINTPSLKKLLTQHVTHPDTQKEWLTIHFLVLFLMQMQLHLPDLKGGASISKAIALLEHLKGHNGMTIANKKQITEIWNKYKNVSHFIVPFITAQSNRLYHPFLEKGLPLFLGYTKTVQTFLLQIRPQNSSMNSLIKQDDMWTIPHDIILPVVDIDIPPFSEKETAFFLDRRNGYKSGS